ncbi:hypothetical protein CVT24_003347 [Panaeolus cyanescens]|uniref:Plasma membrane fusion protein PRM1 n=1 Tax=Panaeolus cyanescens TaxID=181874 RepID=A0A409Y730_9AGAR|nr:hypothetical protein CVT24_003347 [Panaeolus cyanescens]
MSSSRFSPPPTYDARLPTSLTPYLQLPHLLSLTWLAYPILSLLFVAFRLQISLKDAQESLASAKDNLLASCKAAEEAATSAASMPRFMAIATNKQFADAANGSINAARATLVMALTVMEAIINFIIDLYRSTFLCFLELVVRGGLALLIGAANELNELLQSATNALRGSIQNDIASVNNAISTAIDGINRINPFSDIPKPTIPVPNLDGLNIALPDSFTQALTNLNASIPSVAQLKDSMQDVINTPFELLKKDINDTFAGISFEPSGMPVPQQSRITFCNDLDMSVVDDLSRDFVKMAKIGVIILILIALFLTGLNCLLTWYKWRCMKSHLEYTRQAWMTDPTIVHTKTSTTPQVVLTDHNLMMLQANSEHPLITRIMNQISSRFRLSTTQHIHTNWFLNYIFHAPALACLLIGIIGILSIQVQLLALGPLVAKYDERAAAATANFTDTITNSINNNMYNQSAAYANEVNAQVDAFQSQINDGVFGWVNVTTTSINSTINNFYSDIEKAVATVFNGTILETPANEFLRCFLGTKVDAIENALTFLHDNLHVDMPRVNQSVLILSPESVKEATQPIALAASGGSEGDGNGEGLIPKLVRSYTERLKSERIMFAIFLAIWGFVVLMGLAVVIWHSFVKPFVHERGRKKWEQEQRSGVEGISPFTGGLAADEKGSSDKVYRSFSPLPSPRASAFKPFWASRSNSPEDKISPSSSQESVTRVFHNTPKSEKRKTNKLLAVGKKAMAGRGERLKPDGSSDVAIPLSPSAAESNRDGEERNTVWYGRMTSFLQRKKSQASTVDIWDKEPAKTPTTANPVVEKPKLRVYTQRALDKYGPPPPEEVNRSRWSVTPKTANSGWESMMSPNSNNVPYTPLSTTAPPLPKVVIEPVSPRQQQFAMGVPIRPTNNNVPLDVRSYEEDPFMAVSEKTTLPAPIHPIPLYNGFDSRYPSPPKHPQLQNMYNQASPPPRQESPRLAQHSLAPPPHQAKDRHRRSSSLGASTWRVTNAMPGDIDASSASSIAPSAQDDLAITPVTRLLTTTHARHSSNVNPFITPFDDEHRVKIDQPSGLGLRKSMQTNPFAPIAI